tara:strand:- start:62 stop:445 length:384 start_codon:yes stop_codon:yes gene_type:complete
MWKLKKLSTNEELSEAGPLPVNWGPIFGLEGIKDRLGELSWLGDKYSDMGWVEVEGSGDSGIETSSEADLAWDKAKAALRSSDWTMLPDVPMTASQKDAWILYRKSLREIRSQSGFPSDITWPSAPE